MFGLLAAFGRSILTECVSKGAVIMNMTSSTSITSTSGTTLISAAGIGRLPLSMLPKAIMTSFQRGPRQEKQLARDVHLQLNYWFLIRQPPTQTSHAQRHPAVPARCDFGVQMRCMPGLPGWPQPDLTLS